MNDIAEKLRELMARGYRFVHPRNTDGHVVAVTGIRAHHDVVDVFQLYGEHAANAARMPRTEQDVLSPRCVLWRSSGTAADVIDDLLDLAEPTPAPVSSKAGGCWVQTRPGRATWLSATA
ncbi:MAG TPA: hypothetical protein VHF06_25040 [Pseudonocardiaceae bacterium]|nr:hypothetical protein [Pseudonocardiaceae bacterium]